MGGYFLYQAIASTPSDKVNFSYIAVILLSVSIFGFVLINLINLRANGKDFFFDLNNSFFKSNRLLEDEEKSKQFDDFIKK